MIRVKFELLPAGVDDFAQSFASVVIGCKFPIDNSSRQNLFVISEGFYTELKAYDLQSTLYSPPDGKPKLINICMDAIKALQTTGKRIAPAAIYPGAMSPDPKEFYKIIGDIAAKYPQVKRVTLFGRRAHEQISISKFYNEHNSAAADFSGKINGGFYFKNYPSYISWDVAIKQDGGEEVERAIVKNHSLRKHPHAPEMRCYNNIRFCFVRGDGRVSVIETSSDITTNPPRVKVYPVMQSAPILAEIERGRVIYQRGNGSEKL